MGVVSNNSGWKARAIEFPGGELKCLKFLLTSANILAMNATPVTVIPAPGAGKALALQSVLFSFTHGTSYANGGTTQLQYHGASTNIMHSTVAAAVFTGSSDAILQFDPATTASGIVVTSNAAIEITNATAPFITGTGTAKIMLLYAVMTL